MHACRRRWLGFVITAVVASSPCLLTDVVEAASGTWNSSTASAWISTSNWNVSGTYPGALTSTANTDVAVFSSTAISSSALGLNLNTPADKTFSTGGILWNYTTASGTIGNSSTAASGTLRLNGGSFNVGSTGGTITNLLLAVGDSATQNLSINNAAQGGTQTMKVLLNTTTGTMYVANGRTLTVNVPIIEPAATPTGFTKSGTGVLTLAGANTYTGVTTLAGGTLALSGGNDRLATTGTLAYGGSNTTFDLGSTSQTLVTLRLPQSGTTTGMTVSGNGGSLTLTGSIFQVGPDTSSASPITALSLANLSTFAYTNSTGTMAVGLAGGAATSGSFSLTLAGTNTITAAKLGVGAALVGTSGFQGQNDLFLGASNTLRVGGIYQGGNGSSNGRSNTSLQFAAGTSGTLSVRGSNGTAPSDLWLVGQSQNFNNATASTSTVDLTSGTSDIAVTSLMIGAFNNGSSTDRQNKSTGSFTMGPGTLSTGSITIASAAGSGGIVANSYSRGLLTINNPATVVTATTVNFSENLFSGTGVYASGTTLTVSGSLAMSAGTLRARTITRGAQTGVSAVVVSTTFTISGGTLANLSGTNLTVSTLPITFSSGTATLLADAGRTITVDAASPIGGAGGLTKDGSGTLALQAANTFTGTTRVANGTLSLEHVSALAGSTLDLNAADAGTLNLALTGSTYFLGGLAGSKNVDFSTIVPVIGGNGQSTTYSGTVTSPNGLTKVGSGTLTLGADNSFPLLAVAAGGLRLGATTTIPATARVEMGNSGSSIATLDTNGYNPTFAVLTSISTTTGTVGNNGGTASVLTLTGSTYNSIPNTVISRTGTGSLTIGAGTGTLGLTLDTGAGVPVIDNGIGLVIASAITSANGFTKSGGGILALSANNTSTLSALITGSAGTLAARTSGALGSGTVAVSGATLQFDTNNGSYANPIVATTASLIKATNVQATLTGPITISGSTVFNGGGGNNNQFILSNANAITSTNDSSVAFSLDASQVHQVTGIISLGAGTVTKQSTATLALSNDANSYGELIQAGNGGITISANGAQGNGPITFASGGGGTITFANVSGTVSNAIVANGGSGGITKIGNSTMTLTGANTYAGSTVAGAGTLAFAADQNLSGALITGSAAATTTTANVDFSAASGTFGGLTVRTNSATPNVITVGSGRTLAINGSVTVGVNSAAGVATALTATGGGAWNVTNATAGAVFQLGAATGSTNTNPTTVDASGLGSFTVNFTNASSMVRVGDNNGTSTTVNSSTMTLAPSSTITSATVAVGDACGSASTQALLLGGGSQVINANTLAVGQNTVATSSIRSSGLLQFAGATGSLTVRGQDGISGAELAMNRSSSYTTSIPVATFDVTGHSADMLFSTIDMTIISASSSGGTVGAFASTLSFDRGTLTSGTTNLGKRLPGLATSGNFAATATIGSASNYENSASLGAVTLAAHSGSNCTIRGVLNITGTATSVSMASLSVASNTAGTAGGTSSGTVAISGGATTVAGGITLATSAGFGTVNGTLNLTGGSLTVGGNITQAGAVTGSLAVNGGSLDMAGFAIGSLANPISSASFLSGTLRNLGEYNGGAQLSKTGGGTLVLGGSGAFTGGVQVNAGTLTGDGVSAFGSGTLAVNGGTLDLAGLAVTNPLEVSLGSVSNAAAYAGTQTVSGTTSYAGTVGGALNVLAGGLLKGSNVTFSGPVSIAGTHSPGSSPGLQTFTGGLGYTSASTLVWELSANTASAVDRGILYDAIDTTTSGALTIDPAATISLVFNAPLADSTPSSVNWDDSFWANEHQWKVIDVVAPVTWNQVTFGNVLVGNDATGASLAAKRPQASFTVAADGGSLYVVYVPEPSLLTASVGIGLLLVARRRR